MLRPILPLLLVLTLIAGCNRGGDGGGKKADGGKKLRIVYIPKNTGNPYFDEVNRGFADAANEMGAEFATTAPATADATSQIPIIKEQIQRGVDVLAITPNSPDALNPVLKEARERGITVITVDADLGGDYLAHKEFRNAAVLPADFNQIGPSQVELLGKLTGYEGDFAILSATTDAPNQNAWIAKMKEALKDAKYAKMHLVDLVYGDDEPQKSTTECEALLAKHPGLRGIISPTSVGLAASAQVVERAGVYPGGAHASGKGLELTGLSTPNQLKKFVANGVVTAFQLWAPYNEGYIAAYLGRSVHGGLTPTPVINFDAGKLKTQRFTDSDVVIAGPLQTFDKTNIGQFSF